MTRPRISVALLAVACAMVVATTLPDAALAAGTGDDPTPTRDVLTPAEAAKKAKLEAQFGAEEARSGNAASYRASGASAVEPATVRHATGVLADVGPAAVDAPYEYTSTPSHEQERTYYCGPASVQVVDDYFGSYASQASIASYMGTTTNGTDFSKADDALRNYVGKAYYYYGDLTESSFNSRVAHSLEAHRQPLLGDVKVVASVWAHYNYDHDGHIIPLEAYDWRYMSIRINDPYDESRWKSGGGDTYGRTTYGQAVIWDGIYRHFRRAVVAAP